MEKTQHFTNDELILLSDAILAMQKRPCEASAILNGIGAMEVDVAFIRLRDLNNKVCGYMNEE